MSKNTMPNLTTDPRVTFFLPDLRLGGIERVTLNLANGLKNRGFKIDIVLARMSGEFAN